MNLSKISNKSVIGKLLRSSLRIIPSQTRMPILQGKLQGKKWIVGSSQHGCWLGSYEYEKQTLFTKTIHKGSVVFDLGAHVGFHSLLASVLVGSQGKVYAFEPMPKNLSYLKEHIKINKIKNIAVINAAVSDSCGTAYFQENICSFQGHLASVGNIKVKTVSLDEMISQGEIPNPNYIKIDVEGAELQVLNGAKNLLATVKPTIFLATHGDEIQRQCRIFLESIGYRLEAINGKPLEVADELIARY
ncbi:MAG: FkbM family methyltransferase [Cyanobacteria bacterium J06636_27]